MLSVFKPVAEKSLQPIAKLLHGINPNLLSALGLIFPVLFFALLMNELYWWALLVFIFNGADMLDGMVARATNRVTAFGGFLDSTIDRFADFVVIAAFAFAGIADWSLIAPLIMLTYLISYMRSRIELAANNTLKADVGLIERTERLLALFAGLLLYAIFPDAGLFGQNIVELTCWILIGLSIITVWQRGVFAYKKLS
ncbi:MAG TPA: CDP-alcohol phosphatidyltransferase family protein [Candidatus Saccharimonadales bacterium]